MEISIPEIASDSAEACFPAEYCADPMLAAPNSVNPKQLQTLRICRIVSEGIPLSTETSLAAKDNEPNVFERYMVGFRLEPVAGAYFLLVRLIDGEAVYEPSMDRAVFCRTGADGELLLANEDQACASGAGRDPILFVPDEPALYYWTYAKDIFLDVVRAARKNLKDAIRDHGFSGFRVRVDFYKDDLDSKEEHIPQPQWSATSEIGMLALLENPLKRGLITSCLRRKLTANDFSGLLPPRAIEDFAAELELKGSESQFTDQPYLVVGSNAIHGLYLSEIIRYHALATCEIQKRDLTLFAQATEITMVTLAGERAEVIDAAGRVARGSGHYHEFHDYARECALRKIDRKLFVKAADVTALGLPSDRDWGQAAREIRRMHPDLTHPSLRAWEGIPPLMTIDSKFMTYCFDYYRFGLDQPKQSWFSRYQKLCKQMDQFFRTLETKSGEFMAKHLTYDNFSQELAAHFPMDENARANLNLRYADHACFAHYRWWESFQPSSSKLRHYFMWLASTSGRVGTLWRVAHQNATTVQTIQARLLDKRRHIEAYVKTFTEMSRLAKTPEGQWAARSPGSKTLTTAMQANGSLTISAGGMNVLTVYGAVQSQKSEKYLRSRFKQWALEVINSDPNHPLRIFVDPKTKKFYRNQIGFPDTPSVDAGHGVSKYKGRGHFFGLEDSDLNRNWPNRHEKPEWNWYDKEFILIGGVPIERQTARFIEKNPILGGIKDRHLDQLMLPAGTVANAPIVGGAVYDDARKAFVIETDVNTAKLRIRKPISIEKLSLKGRVGPIHKDPLPGVPKWPDYLSAFGDTLALALSLQELTERLLDDKELKALDGTMLIAKVAKDTFQCIDSVSTAFPVVRTMLLNRFGPAAQFVFRRASVALEVVLNLAEGGKILLLNEDSLAAQAVMNDDPVIGWLEYSKGIILVASPAPGAVCFLGSIFSGAAVGAAAASAFVPLTIGLSVAAIAVTGINLAIWEIQGPPDALGELREELAKAEAAEWQNQTGRTESQFLRLEREVSMLLGGA